MDQAELLAHVAKALESAGVPYFVTGSVASMFYGAPRLTIDIDIVVDLKPEQVAPFLVFFPKNEYYVDDEAALSAIRHGTMFNIIHQRTALKVDLIVAERSPLNFSRFSRVRQVTTSPGRQVRVSSPEDVIVSKLRSYQEGGSEKHLNDIAGILRESRDSLDLSYIKRWVEQWDLREVWDKLLANRG